MYFLTISEAAEYVGVSTRTIRRWVAAGRLRAYRLAGCRLLFRVEDLDGLAEQI